MRLHFAALKNALYVCEEILSVVFALRFFARVCFITCVSLGGSLFVYGAHAGDIDSQSNTLSSGNVRVLSFNVRTEYANDPGERNWTARKHRVLASIVRSGASIVGLQEASEAQQQYLLKGLGLKWASSEYRQILYRHDLYTVEKSGRIELIEDKWEPRSAEWLQLNDTVSKKSFIFMNTHWGVDALSQIGSANILKQKIPIVTEDWLLPTILVGDFNVLPRSEPYLVLANKTPLQNQFYGKTFTEFNVTADRQLDYVWTHRLRSANCSVFHKKEEGLPPASDHYPVVCDVELGH